MLHPYVPLYLFELNELPKDMPDYVRVGDSNEAISYVADAIELWAKNKKASIWSFDMSYKMRNNLELLIRKKEDERLKGLGLNPS